MRDQSREEQVELLSFCRRSMARNMGKRRKSERKRRKRRKEGEKEKKLYSETLEPNSAKKKRKSAGKIGEWLYNPYRFSFEFSLKKERNKF